MHTVVANESVHTAVANELVHTAVANELVHTAVANELVHTAVPNELMQAASSTVFWCYVLSAVTALPGSILVYWPLLALMSRRFFVQQRVEVCNSRTAGFDQAASQKS